MLGIILLIWLRSDLLALAITNDIFFIMRGRYYQLRPLPSILVITSEKLSVIKDGYYFQAVVIKAKYYDSS